MADARKVHFYLEEPFRQSAAAGEHNFINLMVNVLRPAGFEPVFARLPHDDPPKEGYSLSHMVQPPNDRGLVFRRVYHYPFWRIEAVAQRWHSDVAKAAFDPAMPAPDAPRFYRFWQKRLFGAAAEKASRDGFVYVPLQGHLGRTRVFQACAPLEMVELCLAHLPDKKIVAALHPNENYAADDLNALNRLAQAHPKLTIDTGNMEKYLSGCDFVVTQNSGVAFSGFLFGKPALLFGKIDFHHICQKIDLTTPADAFAAVAQASPDFQTYVWWFWQEMSINAGRGDAEDKIAARLRRFNWPV